MSEKMVLNVVKKSFQIEYIVDQASKHVVGAMVVNADDVDDLDVLTAVGMAHVAMIDCIRWTLPQQENPLPLREVAQYLGC